MDSIKFLDAVRARHGIPSDNKLAKFLGIEQARVSSYRRGRRKLDLDACIAVAKALELPPEHVFAAVQAERAKRTEHRRIWERLARHAKDLHVLAVVALLAVASTPTTSHTTEVGARDLYILLTRRRWRLAPATGGRGGGHDRRQRIAALTRLDRRHHDRRRGHSGRRSQIVARSV